MTAIAAIISAVLYFDIQSKNVLKFLIVPTLFLSWIVHHYKYQIASIMKERNPSKRNVIPPEL